MTKYYKVLNDDLSAIIGKEKWLEKGWMPPIKGDLIPCKNGYHLYRENALINWLGPAIFEVEYRGEIIKTSNKVVVREARLIHRLDRWNTQTSRLFALDCAEHVLHIYEKQFPGDNRVRDTIENTRKIINNKNSSKTLANTIAIAKANAAANTAANAAYAVANAAAHAADAANIERKWQTKRLFQYLNGDI